MNKPIFGEEEQLVDYQTHYTTYIVIKKDQQITIIEVPNDAFFLPGGEIEGDETKGEATVRELIRGVGITAEITFYLGETNEYFYSNYHATYHYNPGYFFVTDSWKHIGESTEEANKIQWVSPRETPDKLERSSHRWAIERWIEENNK